jgi:hypothetical protein
MSGTALVRTLWTLRRLIRRPGDVKADHRGIPQSQAEPNYRCAAMMSGVPTIVPAILKKKQIVGGEAVIRKNSIRSEHLCNQQLSKPGTKSWGLRQFRI